jgi:hypothetical protein
MKDRDKLKDKIITIIASGERRDTYEAIAERILQEIFPGQANEEGIRETKDGFILTLNQEESEKIKAEHSDLCKERKEIEHER